MTPNPEIEEFLSQYDEKIFQHAQKLRQLLITHLPDITEQLDMKAKMIAYCYGQKYVELICVIIPSKKGLKLGFNRGTELPDPAGLLEGTGKISRYIPIKSADQIESPAITELLTKALEIYKERIGIKKPD